jgi:hypothetical protein
MIILHLPRAVFGPSSLLVWKCELVHRVGAPVTGAPELNFYKTVFEASELLPFTLQLADSANLVVFLISGCL